jgi:hypothetical protein
VRLLRARGWREPRCSASMKCCAVRCGAVWQPRTREPCQGPEAAGSGMPRFLNRGSASAGMPQRDASTRRVRRWQCARQRSTSELCPRLREIAGPEVGASWAAAARLRPYSRTSCSVAGSVRITASRRFCPALRIAAVSRRITSDHCRPSSDHAVAPAHLLRRHPLQSPWRGSSTGAAHYSVLGCRALGSISL